jgi:hypothetical protein
MRKRLSILAIGALSALGLFAAPAANAAGELCYDVQVNAAGTSVVSQAGCQQLP